MTDTQRIDKLEKCLKSIKDSNGIAIMPLNNDTLFTIDDICNQDGSNFGEVLSEGKTIRNVIDNLPTI